MLAAIDADESERYERKKDVLGELEEQRLRIQELQAKLYAENEKGLLIVLQAMDTGGKDGGSTSRDGPVAVVDESKLVDALYEFGSRPLRLRSFSCGCLWSEMN